MNGDGLGANEFTLADDRTQMSYETQTPSGPPLMRQKSNVSAVVASTGCVAMLAVAYRLRLIVGMSGSRRDRTMSRWP